MHAPLHSCQEAHGAAIRHGFTAELSCSTGCVVRSQLFAIWPYAAVAAAYFTFGVAVGAFIRGSQAPVAVTVALIAPGVLATLGFVAWTVFTLV
jgi:hypothetical protein